MPRKTSPKSSAPTVNKSAFVRGLPASMSAADVVKAAAAKGIKLSDKFVHTIRYNAKVKARRGKARLTPRRGPGRPRKDASGAPRSSGLVAEIERIVEAKVQALLRERLSGLFHA